MKRPGGMSDLRVEEVSLNHRRHKQVLPIHSEYKSHRGLTGDLGSEEFDSDSDAERACEEKMRSLLKKRRC